MGRYAGSTKKNKKDRRTTDRRRQDPEEYAREEERQELKPYADLHNPSATEELKRRMDPWQAAYYKAARMSVVDKKIIIIDEKAGTGKTTVAFAAAIEALRAGKVKRITYLRFPSRRGQKLGALPGDLTQKEDIYMQPAYEALEACGLQTEAVIKLMERKLIRFTTDVTLRGTNMAEEFVIIDEAQNAEDVEQMKLVLTRLHDSSKAVLIGDSGQKDSNVKTYYGLNAFQVYTVHLLKKPWAARYRLVNNYRGEIAQHADAIEETLKELGA